MKNLKEQYLTLDSMEVQVNAIRAEVDHETPGKRRWEGRYGNVALVVTDMQNYFLDPGSHAFIPSAPAIKQRIIQLISHFRNHHAPVIFTRHINDADNAGSMNWWWKDLIQENTYMASFTEGIDPGNDRVVMKNQYDAFHSTELEELLRTSNTEYLVICGVMTNLCCETTTRSAFVKGFRPVLPLDATATYNREMHIATFRNLSFGFSPIMTTIEIIETVGL